MPDSLLSELALAKKKVAKLEQKVAQVRARELADLPAKYGFDSVAAFIAAVKGTGTKSKSKPAKAAEAPSASSGKTRKRAVITDTIKAKVGDLVKAGTSGAKIAKMVGISLPSVQNVKKSLGLVNARKPKAPKPPKADKAKKAETPAK